MDKAVAPKERRFIMANQKDDLSQGVQNVLSNVPGSGGGGGGSTPGALTGPDNAFSVLWSSTGLDYSLGDYEPAVTNDDPVYTELPPHAAIVGNPPSATAGISQTYTNSSGVEFFGCSFALPARKVD